MSDIVNFAFFFAGICLTLLFFWLSKKQAVSIARQNANAAGRSKQEAQGERITVALAEAMQMSKEPDFQKEGQPDFVKIGLALLPKYPDVALQLVKKLGFKGLKDLV